MAGHANDLPPIDQLIRGDGPDGARRVLHWYDLMCPFCYVGQQRNTIFAAHGFDVVELPFQAHPEIPPGGRPAGERSDALVARIGAEAQASGLPLAWPARLPNSRMALAAAESGPPPRPRCLPLAPEGAVRRPFRAGPGSR